MCKRCQCLRLAAIEILVCPDIRCRDTLRKGCSSDVYMSQEKQLSVSAVVKLKHVFEMLSSSIELLIEGFPPHGPTSVPIRSHCSFIGR
ncbi:hypothetical protein T08_13968 [Trichinella sp. T8]|nr:hypothetical protein T08_13968 [Trichinella sp. T8]